MTDCIVYVSYVRSFDKINSKRISSGRSYFVWQTICFRLENLFIKHVIDRDLISVGKLSRTLRFRELLDVSRAVN